MRALLFIAFALHGVIAIGQSCDDLQGEWINELGSVLQVDSISIHGEIHGVYKSSTGVDGKTFPLIGWVNNYQTTENNPVSIAFSVRWEGYSSITSWTGSCDVDDKGPKIKTLWHLVRPEQEFEWERIISNSSTFRPLID